MRGVALGLTFLAFGPASAADAPDLRQRIVPGQAIGKVRIGMSLAQVRAILGPPEALIRRERRSFAREWAEYSWSFTSWRIGFDVVSGKHEVVSIRSSARHGRTAERVGLGTLGTRVQRTYGVVCRPAWSQLPVRDSPASTSSAFLGYGCVVRTARGRVMFFLVSELCGNVPSAGRCSTSDRRWGVSEFGVVAPGERVPFDLGDFEPRYPPLR